LVPGLTHSKVAGYSLKAGYLVDSNFPKICRHLFPRSDDGAEMEKAEKRLLA
jgi:hypothetical protein